jgi:predicted secreted protein
MSQSAGYLATVKHSSTLNGTYTSIDGTTSASDSDGIDELDVSDLADQDGFRRFIMGLRGVTIQLEQDLIYGDTQQDALRTAFAARTTVFIQYLPDGTNGAKGEFFVTSINKSTPVDGKATASVALRLTGALTAVP